MSERESKETTQVDEKAGAEFIKRLKTTSTSRKPLAQRLDAPKPTDFGPQIVGQSHVFAVELPRVVDPNAGAGHASATLEENAEFSPAKRGFVPMFSVAFGEPSRSFDVRYTPTARGHFETNVELVASWEDGHVENVKVPVVGAGRELTDARAAPEKPRELFDTSPYEAKPEVAAEQEKQAMTLGLSKSVDAVRDSLDALFAIAGDAVNELELQESQYKAPLPPVSIWVHLAQIAVEVGLSMLSEELGKLAGRELARVLGHAAAEAHESAIERFGKGLEKSVEASVKESKIVEIETNEVEEKKAEPHASGEAETSHNEKTAKVLREAAPRSGGQKKTEPRAIRFFEAQKDAITLSSAKTKSKVTEHVISLAELLGPDSASVNTGLEMTRTNVDGLIPKVRSAQQDASLAQWMNALARADLGVSSGPKDANPTTMLDDVRESREGRSGRSARGLLEILVSTSGDSFAISGARVRGISSDSAERLLDMDLQKCGMPIVIRIGPSKTITVDEVGRVRSEGRSYEPGGMFTMPSTEAKDDLLFTELVKELLERPLSEQGVKEIETDARKD